MTGSGEAGRRVHRQKERNERGAARPRVLSRSFARSAQATSRPASFNHAAGDASPNGWRPMS